MIKFLVRKYIPEYENTTDVKVRERYGVLGGTLGIICNIVLFALKLIIGLMMNSIAIISDSINNLSDSGSSLITLVGSKLSNMRADKEHPFGHGRIEYISSLIVSFVIMLVGFELMKSSIEKVRTPAEVDFSILLVVILSLSVLVKLWMFGYNRYLGKAINSSVLLATSQDSINDAISTGAVIISTIVGKLINFPPLDGIVGTAVSVLVMYSGFGIARKTIGLLLGVPPEKETVARIKEIIMSGENVVGVHDLIIHDYGPGRVLASVHAEVPDDTNIVKAHEVIDSLERLIHEELDIEMVIHLDPISVNDERVNEMRAFTARIINEINSSFSFHDFRMTDGDEIINLIFDVEVPIDLSITKRTADIASIKNRIHAYDNRFNAVINVDDLY